MKINKFVSILALLLVFCSVMMTNMAFLESFKKPLAAPLQDSIPHAAKVLMIAYPEQIIGFANNHIIWHDSTTMLFDDTIKNKSFQALLDSADIEDQIAAMSYPITPIFKTPKKFQDPGRVRYQPFFLKMYGQNEVEVKKNLVEIEAFGQNFKVTKINGIDKKIVLMWRELQQNPEWSKYLKNIGGIFTWRKISGTTRLSAHSFGMTIDINTEFSNYWQWDSKDWKIHGENVDLKYRNKIPLALVAIFEKYGFIWGGKWYHYDTMHFEYRPELFVK